jgi:hypothetical protein
MKIIMTEDQMDKFTSKFRQLIEKHGFVEVSEMMGINKLKLAEMSGLPIKGDIRDSRFIDDSEIVISDLLSDLIKKDNKYKTCELGYYNDGVLLWECRFKDEENYYLVGVDVSPYWDGDNETQVSITNVHITPIDSPKDKKEYEVNRYVDRFDCPELFNNVDELIVWFENEYKPTAYNMIIDMLEDFKLRRL